MLCGEATAWMCFHLLFTGDLPKKAQIKSRTWHVFIFKVILTPSSILMKIYWVVLE
jgi:hypothetical protein